MIPNKKFKRIISIVSVMFVILSFILPSSAATLSPGIAGGGDLKGAGESITPNDSSMVNAETSDDTTDSRSDDIYQTTEIHESSDTNITDTSNMNDNDSLTTENGMNTVWGIIIVILIITAIVLLLFAFIPKK